MILLLGAMMASENVYTLAGLHVPLGSITADLCVVYISPVTSSHYTLATFVGSATIPQQGLLIGMVTMQGAKLFIAQ